MADEIYQHQLPAIDTNIVLVHTIKLSYENHQLGDAGIAIHQYVASLRYYLIVSGSKDFQRRFDKISCQEIFRLRINLV